MMVLRSLGIVLTTLLALQNQPTFRSGVELIRLDVSVLDRDGRPIRDLQPGDFDVRIDGKPRSVTFARFYGPPEIQPADTREKAVPSFASNLGAVQGRVVVLVVDLESMEPGYERALLDAAGALVDNLGEADSVGLLPIPGKAIDLTRDRGRVREALERLQGLPNHLSAHQHVIAVREAEAIVRGDQRTLGEVVERECFPTDKQCRQDIVTREAPQLLIEVGRHVQNVVHTVSDLTARLSGIDAPRTIVLISAGLPFKQGLASLFNELRQRAAETGTRTFVLQLEQPDADATRSGRSRVASLPKEDLAEGLSNIAGVTGGTYRAGVGRAVGVFERIRSEVVYSYQLGVESVPSDADGKRHTITVEVRRKGAAVQSRRELIVPASARRARSPVDVLALPPGTSEVPMAATAFSTRGENASSVKVLFLVETFRQSTTPGTYAVTLTKVNDDRAAFETSDALTPQAAGGRAVFAAQMAPGRYWYRAAVVDSDGRAGSVEMPLDVVLHEARALRWSDLLIGRVTDRRFAPATHVAQGVPIAVLLELYAANPRAFDGIAVDFELHDVRSGAVVGSVPGSINAGAPDDRLVVDGVLDFPTVPPGAYVVSAVLKQEGQAVGTVTRTFIRP